MLLANTVYSAINLHTLFKGFVKNKYNVTALYVYGIPVYRINAPLLLTARQGTALCVCLSLILLIDFKNYLTTGLSGKYPVKLQ